jgi:hypothetical protein
MAETEAAWAMLTDNGLGPDQLGALLTEAVGDGSNKVSAVTPKVIGTGQVGENVRCSLTWTVSSDELPSSVVVKMASSDPTSRAAAEATRTYVREVGFYRDVAGSVTIRIPAAYHVSEERDQNRFVLVMEDITPARVGDQLSGCGLAEATMAVQAAADLHGSTWGRADELAALDWVDSPTEERAAERTGLFDMVFPGFVDRYRERLTADELAFGQWLSANYQTWQEARLEPQCLIHGDFRLDNMLFGTTGEAPPITTVDWQTPSLGYGLSDVAYFLSGSLEADELATNEPALLGTYRGRLAEQGVTLSEEQVWRDYRMAAPGGYVMAVIASQLVGQTERGDDMFMVMAKGAAAQALRVDTAGLLD